MAQRKRRKLREELVTAAKSCVDETEAIAVFLMVVRKDASSTRSYTNFDSDTLSEPELRLLIQDAVTHAFTPEEAGEEETES